MAVSQCFRAVRKTETIVDVNRLIGSILLLRLYIERKRLKRAQVPLKSMFPLSDATTVAVIYILPLSTYILHPLVMIFLVYFRAFLK